MKKISAEFWTVEKTVTVGFSLALLILVGIGVVSNLTITRLIETAAWVDRTHHIQKTLSDLRAQLVAIESGARGYVLTGDEEYLSPYHSGIQNSWVAYGELEKSIQDADQRRRLARLPALISDRIEIARALVVARQSQGFDEAVALVRGGAGKKVMDSIRATLDEMDAAEERLLVERSSFVNRSAARARIVLGGGIFLAVLIVVVAGFIIRRGMLERHQAEKALLESRQSLQDFLDHANDLIQIAAPDGRFIYVNRKWRETLGYSESEVTRLRCQDVIHPDCRQRQEIIRQHAIGGKRVEDFETVFLTKDGHSVTVSGNMNVRIENGHIAATRSIFRNITESKRAEEALQRSNEVLLRSVNELEQRTREISTLSEMGDMLQSCQRLEEAYKVISEFVPQMLPSDSGTLGIISPSRNIVEIAAEWGPEKYGERVFSPEDCWALRRGRMHMVREPTSALHCRHLGGAAPESYFCLPLVAQGEAVGLLHLKISPNRVQDSSDWTAQTKLRLIEAVADRIALALANLKLQEGMRQQSVRDPLTGLFNRRYMEESLERELRRAARSNRSLGILMLDLDFFKHFNDDFGHDAGDAMLREFSTLLSASIRGGDIACRYGGEEFALILPEASLEATSQRGELLREKTKHLSFQHRGLSLGTVTLSVGVAAFPQHGTTSEELLRAADEALYTAKQSGRDRVMLAPPSKL